ncbi:MAG: hypothetical protein ACI8RZ_003896 [Myxococcota bacterium]|jgi:hypothetical protein
MLLLLLACPADPPAEAPEPPLAEPVIESIKVIEPVAADAEPTPPVADPVPLPAGVPWTGESVALVGYGIRFTLNPPFQAAWMGSVEGEGTMVAAWWDVNTEKAGRSGAAGLHNIGIHVGPVPEGSPSIRSTTMVKRGETVYALQLGETGTKLELPEGFNALGGMGTVEPGPAHEEWKVQVGSAEPMSWSGRDMLHSWDPADGGPAKFIQRPTRPWGPWVE